MTAVGDARKRQIELAHPPLAPSSLTDAERDALFCRPRELNVSRDTAVLEGIVERILASRLAKQREQIVEALSNEPADRVTWDDGTEFIAVDSAARIVRGGAR